MPVENPFGSVDIAGDYQELIDEVVLEGLDIYDLTYDLVIEMMTAPQAARDENAILSQLKGEDLIQLMVAEPEKARLILQRLRRMKEREGVEA